jgi:PAS domain S-box-containing protein
VTDQGRPVEDAPLQDAELDTAARRALWDLAVDAAGVGTFDLDLVTGALVWDDRLLELFGYDRATFDRTLESFNRRVHPDDLPRVLTALQDAIDTCGTYEAEYRVVRPDDTLWVRARGRALCDASGSAVRVLGAAYDTTELREGEARISRVLETMSAAFYSLDRQWRFTYVNAEAERLLGSSRSDLLGGNIWELFPAAVGSEFERNYTRAMATGEAAVFEAYYPAPLDGWYELRAWPSPDGLAVYFLDVTERRASLARATLLSEAAAELSDTLDPQEAVARLARIVVPALGDWCIVTLVDSDADPAEWRRALRDVGSCHADPDMQQVLEDYAARRIESAHDGAYLAQVMRTGKPIVVEHPDRVRRRHVLTDDTTRDLLRQLRAAGAVVQPMRARGRILGLLSLCWHDRAEPRPADLATLAELADRAGLALDNARLYDQQRRLAEGLQRSLLTEPPEPNHLQVVVRYEPAAQSAAVGGDWYDSLLQEDGATVLAIGDVVGHDADAAAAMGQVRGCCAGSPPPPERGRRRS